MLTYLPSLPHHPTLLSIAAPAKWIVLVYDTTTSVAASEYCRWQVTAKLFQLHYEDKKQYEECKRTWKDYVNNF